MWTQKRTWFLNGLYGSKHGDPCRCCSWGAWVPRGWLRKVRLTTSTKCKSQVKVDAFPLPTTMKVRLGKQAYGPKYRRPLHMHVVRRCCFGVIKIGHRNCECMGSLNSTIFMRRYVRSAWYDRTGRLDSLLRVQTFSRAWYGQRFVFESQVNQGNPWFVSTIPVFH